MSPFSNPDMLDMEATVRRQNQEHSASITSMIRHYVARRAQVTEGHPHNADERALVHAYSQLNYAAQVRGIRQSVQMLTTLMAIALPVLRSHGKA